MSEGKSDRSKSFEKGASNERPELTLIFVFPIGFVSKFNWEVFTEVKNK